ncbi:MAG: 50S ribosomal protein L13 [Verrucomicrobiota bacterium]
MKTTLMKEEDVLRTWYVVDAADTPVGRLAVKVANVLRGKTKPTFTPHVDTGDFVVVVNASKVKLTGAKEEKKMYERFSGYPGGLKLTPANKVRAKNPGYLITHAVRDMLPKNKLSRQIFTRLKVYAGAEHPHAAQKPEPFKI